LTQIGYPQIVVMAAQAATNDSSQRATWFRFGALKMQRQILSQPLVEPCRGWPPARP
jgi:hypothetical protein